MLVFFPLKFDSRCNSFVSNRYYLNRVFRIPAL